MPKIIAHLDAQGRLRVAEFGAGYQPGDEVILCVVAGAIVMVPARRPSNAPDDGFLSAKPPIHRPDGNDGGEPGQEPPLSCLWPGDPDR